MLGVPSADAEPGTVLQELQAGYMFKDRLLRLVDEDTQAFNGVMDALRMPKDTPNQKAARNEALQSGYKHATEVPMSIPTRYVAAIAIPPNANCRTEPSHSGFRVRWAAAAPAISRP